MVLWRRLAWRESPTALLLTGTIHVSLREQNILDPKVFISQLKDAYNMLLYRGTRLSVTLPDTVGRVMLLDVEGRFKSRTEGLDIIRWKLKKSMPFDVADTHLDYQQLTVRENGSHGVAGGVGLSHGYWPI